MLARVMELMIFMKKMNHRYIIRVHLYRKFTEEVG